MSDAAMLTLDRAEFLGHTLPGYVLLPLLHLILTFKLTHMIYKTPFVHAQLALGQLFETIRFPYLLNSSLSP